MQKFPKGKHTFVWVSSHYCSAIFYPSIKDRQQVEQFFSSRCYSATEEEEVAGKGELQIHGGIWLLFPTHMAFLFVWFTSSRNVTMLLLFLLFFVVCFVFFVALISIYLLSRQQLFFFFTSPTLKNFLTYFKSIMIFLGFLQAVLMQIEIK